MATKATKRLPGAAVDPTPVNTNRQTIYVVAEKEDQTNSLGQALTKYLGQTAMAKNTASKTTGITWDTRIVTPMEFERVVVNPVFDGVCVVSSSHLPRETFDSLQEKVRTFKLSMVIARLETAGWIETSDNGFYLFPKGGALEAMSTPSAGMKEVADVLSERMGNSKKEWGVIREVTLKEITQEDETKKQEREKKMGWINPATKEVKILFLQNAGVGEKNYRGVEQAVNGMLFKDGMRPSVEASSELTLGFMLELYSSMVDRYAVAVLPIFPNDYAKFYEKIEAINERKGNRIFVVPVFEENVEDGVYILPSYYKDMIKKLEEAIQIAKDAHSEGEYGLWGESEAVGSKSRK